MTFVFRPVPVSGRAMPEALQTPQITDAPAAGEKLRVAIFSGNYNYVMDGPVRALNKLVGHLLRRGHDVLVFAPTAKVPALKHEGELIAIPSVPLPGKRSEYRFGFGLKGKPKARLDAFRPNLIHIAAPDYTGFQALKYAEQNAIAAVASFHTRFDTYPRYYGARWLEKHVTDYLRNFYQRCEHVYAPSQSMADELAQDRIGKDIRLWTRGVESTLFSPAKRDLSWRRSKGIADDDIAVAFVGRIVREKGLDAFAEAVLSAAKANPRIKGIVAGDGPERERFQALLPGGIFLGYQQGDDLARAYASSDIFFNPSITETFGNVTLEAMACGLPSVCAAASGSVSLVEDGRTGLLSPPEDGAAGFARKLEILAKSQELRERFGNAARQKSLDFDWSAILDGLIADYRDAIATVGARRRPAA